MPNSRSQAVCVSSTARARGTQRHQCALSRSPAVSPVLLRDSQGVSPALLSAGTLHAQMSLPSPGQGCWSLRRGADLVAGASCSESPGVDGAEPPGLRAWSLPGTKCHQDIPRSLPGPAQALFGLSPEIRNLTPKEWPELPLWDKSPELG